MDFTNINKICLKDHYPSVLIDRLIDAIVGHAVISFLDAIFGYHQILMDQEDAKKTTFITDGGVFYHKVIPFDFKNTGANYERIFSGIFKDLVDKMTEMYVDDINLYEGEGGDCKKAIFYLKFFLSSPLLLDSLSLDKILHLYHAVTDETISTALVHEEESEQRPIHYTNQVLKSI